MLSLYFESTPAVLPLLPRVTWLADLLYSLGVDDDATAPTGGYAFVRFTPAVAAAAALTPQTYSGTLAHAHSSSVRTVYSRHCWIDLEAGELLKYPAVMLEQSLWECRGGICRFFLLCLLMWQPGKLRLPPPSPLRPHSAGRCKLGPAKLEFRSKCCL